MPVGGGGAIYTGGREVNIKNCTFIENYADLYGGAIFLNAGYTNIVQSAFINNLVRSGETKGSAIQSRDWTSLEFSISYSVLLSRDTYHQLILISNLDEEGMYADAEFNYWGTNRQYDIRTNIPMNNYVILTASKDADPVYTGDIVRITVEFKDNNGNTISEKIHDLDLNITPSIGEVTPDSTVLADNVAKFFYTAKSTGTESMVMSNYGTRYTYTFNIVQGVDKRDANPTIDVTVSQSSTISVELPVNLTGQLTINVNGRDYEVTISNGEADLTIQTPPNDYDVVVTYQGDANYNGFIKSTSFSVEKLTTALEISVDNILFGDDAVISASVGGNATGIVVVTVNNKNYTINLVDGEGSVNVYPLDVGTYEVYANYTGDINYYSTTATDSFSVSDSSYITTIYVSQNGSDEDGDGSADSPYKTISKALDRNKRLGGNRTVIVESGEYTLNRYAITDNVTIKANGSVVVSPSYKTNPIYIGGNVSVSLIGLTFINGSGVSAGVIDMGSDGKGNKAKNLTIINCSFIGNSGPVGAIVSYANTHIKQSVFINNTATTASGPNQGVISVRDNPVNIEYSIFLNNDVGEGLTVYSTVGGSVSNNYWGNNTKTRAISSNLDLSSWIVIIPSIDGDVRTKTDYDLLVEFKSTINGNSYSDIDEVMPNMTIHLSAELGRVNTTTANISNNVAKIGYIVYTLGSELINVNDVVNLTFSIDVPEIDKIYVSTTGDNANDGTRTNPVKTIAEAISRNRASGGDKTIIILEGTYHENSLVIADIVTINSEGKVIIDGDGNTIFTISNDTIINNITFTHALNGIRHTGGVLDIFDSTFTNSSNIISSNSNLNIYNSIFTNNTDYIISSTSNLLIDTCQFIRDLENDENYAILSTRNATVVNSRFLQVDAAAIKISGLGVIKNNTFDTIRYAIQGDGADLEISKNTFSNTIGVNLSDSTSKIYDNKFTTGSVAINLVDTNADLKNNNITGYTTAINNVKSNISNVNITFIGGGVVKLSNGTVSLNATITDDMGNIINGGEITFISNGNSLGSAEIVNGIAVLDHYFDTGNYTIYGVFSGSNNNYPASDIIEGLLRINVINYWFIGDVGYETIYEAVEAAEIGDVIKGVPGVYEISKTIDIGHRYFPLEPWLIIKSLTITSLGDEPVTLKGSNVRLFYMDEGSELTLKNIIFTGVDIYDRNGDGGVIETMYGSNLTIINCTFSQNTARYGGALYLWGNTTIKDSVFNNNHAYSGGAIYILSPSSITGDIFMDNVTFTDNDAESYAGAIYYMGSYISKALVNNSQFAGNTATCAGAIFSGYGNLTIDNSKFIENNVFFNSKLNFTAIGGAIYTSSSSDTYIYNSQFINNYAENNGGALDIDAALIIGWTSTDEDYHYYYHGAVLKNCSFINNTADGTGGAIQLGETKVPFLEVYDCIFEGNVAHGDGAAIVNNFGYLTVYDSSFTNNKATNGNNLIYMNGTYNYLSGEFDSNTIIKNTLFKNNDVEYDIYMINQYSIVDLEDCIFDGEKTIILNNGNSTLTNNKQINPKGDDYIIINNERLELSGNEFTNPILNNGLITSPTYVVVMDNETVIAGIGEVYTLNAVVVDDNGNLIEKNTLTFLIDGKEITATLKNHQHTADYDVAAGTHVVSATYADSGLLDLTFKKATLVAKTSSNISVSVNTPVVGEDAVIIVHVNQKATGNVIITVNSEKYAAHINNGIASVNVSNLNAGSYDVDVTYSGSTDYAPGQTNTTLVVSKVSDYNITADASDVREGEDLTITVNVPDDATGTVSVNINNQVYNARITDGSAAITVPNLPEGQYNAVIRYNGDSKYSSASINKTVAIESAVTILAPDVVKYFGGSDRFMVTALDSKQNPIANASITIIINGVIYDKTTNANGKASAPLSLNSGVYNVTVIYANTTINSTVTIKSTVNGSDLVKVYRNASQYIAHFIDANCNVLANTTVSFNINGVLYNRTTNKDGVARLNINLVQGEYVITAINTQTGENFANNITVLSRIINNSDVEMYYRNGTQYIVTLVGDDGNPVSKGVEVSFNINGMIYKRLTNDKGMARLNLNLQAGDYIITAEYLGCRVSNNIKILPVLFSSDMEMAYQDGSRFEARLLGGNGQPVQGENITFNINGIFYDRTTDIDGIARLNINLPSGRYIITSSYNNANTASTITIS